MRFFVFKRGLFMNRRKVLERNSHKFETPIDDIMEWIDDNFWVASLGEAALIAFLMTIFA